MPPWMSLTPTVTVLVMFMRKTRLIRRRRRSSLEAEGAIDAVGALEFAAATKQDEDVAGVPSTSNQI